MDLALMGFSQLSQHRGLLQQYNAKFCFSGEKALLRPDVVEAIEKAIEMTKNNTGYERDFPSIAHDSQNAGQL